MGKFKDYLKCAARNRFTLTGYLAVPLAIAGFSIAGDPHLPEALRTVARGVGDASIVYSTQALAWTLAGFSTFSHLGRARHKLNNCRGIDNNFGLNYRPSPYCKRVATEIAAEEVGLAGDLAHYKPPLLERLF